MKAEGNRNRASVQRADADDPDSHLHAAMAAKPHPRSQDDLELMQWEELYQRVGHYSAAAEFIRLCKSNPEIRQVHPALFVKAKLTVRKYEEQMERQVMRRRAMAVFAGRLVQVCSHVCALFSRPLKASGRVKRLAAVEPSFQADITSVRDEKSMPAAPAAPDVTVDVSATSDVVASAQAGDEPAPAVRGEQYVPARQRRMIDEHRQRKQKR